MQLHRAAYNSSDSVARIERRLRILKYHLHPAAQRFHLSWSELGDISAIKSEIAGAWLEQAKQSSAEGCFTRPGLSNDANCFTTININRNVVQNTQGTTATKHCLMVHIRHIKADALCIDELHAEISCFSSAINASEIGFKLCVGWS